jgi:hypothetical protein
VWQYSISNLLSIKGSTIYVLERVCGLVVTRDSVAPQVPSSTHRGANIRGFINSVFLLSVIDNVAPISYSCAVALPSLNVWPTKRSPHFWQELALSYTGNDAALSIYPTRGSNQIHIQNMWPTKRAPHFWLELALSCIGNVAALLTYTTRGSNQTHI